MGKPRGKTTFAQGNILYTQRQGKDVNGTEQNGWESKTALRWSIGQYSLVKRGLGEPGAGNWHAGFCIVGDNGKLMEDYFAPPTGY